VYVECPAAVRMQLISLCWKCLIGMTLVVDVGHVERFFLVSSTIEAMDVLLTLDPVLK
jgi:hypothetical protein